VDGVVSCKEKNDISKPEKRLKEQKKKKNRKKTRITTRTEKAA